MLKNVSVSNTIDNSLIIDNSMDFTFIVQQNIMFCKVNNKNNVNTNPAVQKKKQGPISNLT